MNKVYVVQGKYAGTWEDLSEEDTPEDARALEREYNLAHPGYPHRVITRHK
jgi:hypothetical protein